MKTAKGFITFIYIDWVIFRKSNWKTTVNIAKQRRNENDWLNHE